jgi:predicted dithiol-disulfide oxidoreductase (DUF899 family)
MNARSKPAANDQKANRVTRHKVVSEKTWLAQRKELLKKEKAFTRLRDKLSRQRRALPWVKVESLTCSRPRRAKKRWRSFSTDAVS